MFRNRVAIQLKKNKVKYFQDSFNTNSKSMKHLWSGIKSIINIKNFQVNDIIKLKDANGNLKAGFHLSELLSEFVNEWNVLCSLSV